MQGWNFCYSSDNFTFHLLQLNHHATHLDEAIELHQRLRFDPLPRVQTELDRLTELAKQLELEIKRG